jgi:hypothetical protein
MRDEFVIIDGGYGGLLVFREIAAQFGLPDGGWVNEGVYWAVFAANMVHCLALCDLQIAAEKVFECGPVPSRDGEAG